MKLPDDYALPHTTEASQSETIDTISESTQADDMKKAG
jgi:hypothetical protein